MRSSKFSALLALLLSAAAVRGSDNVPAVRPAKPVLLRGATVHTVSGADLPATDVLLSDGKISALGSRLTAPAGASVVEVFGKHVYPGLVSAYTGMG
ncbi:MAG: amidohydrolase, partial [Verrucomicrobia bacterium]|nr:amidohydrolase [Verrucomicrobiota bacterium]